MGFMDNLKGQLTPALDGATEQQGGLLSGIMVMINSQPGGLSGLVQTFEQQGMGGVVRSWVSTGPNEPITAAQIQQVLGNEELQAFATAHGIDMNQVSAQLATVLPMVVDKLTPQGTVPVPGAAPAAAPPTGS